ncbi:MAG TPA: cysteine--tRNA ligase [Candidatus Limnocylindrales bacterium]|jgi:cysteinyl-tRNA synthetase|nr:cysteine--tRNA ligase [Candidatus Limnocylindrales bacterium]
MSLRLTNTLGGAVEELEPLEPGSVRMYSCGPTVYGPAHIGNFRSFLFADLLRRYLGWSGYRVTWVLNITDVDDRIIRDLGEKGGTLDELTAPHIERFLADLDRLRVTRPDVMPRATQHIAEMAALIASLLERGHAYRTDDGSIFFRISSWPHYGRLARLDPGQLAQGERVAADDYGKDDVRDFALWKGPREGEPSWQTEIGEGRPGWHIECSAMSMRYLGQSFDIHTGGIDLIFPHHENEIAQSEAATGMPFVSTWLHCAHLQMGGAKMARREGNIARPDEVLALGYRPAHLRYALLATHYRAPLEYSEEALDHARAAVARLTTAVLALDAYVEERPADTSLEGLLANARTSFKGAMDDDLNMSAALAAVFDLVRDLNRRMDERSLSTADARRAAAALRDLDTVLAVLDEPGSLPPGAEELLESRAAARAARDWAASDRLRDELAAMKVTVEDTRDGQRWRVGGTDG